MKRICAWCGKDMGEKAPGQPGVSHGICKRCKELVSAQTLEVRYRQKKIEQIATKIREIKELIYSAIQSLARPSIYHDLLALANELSTLMSEGETIGVGLFAKPAPVKMTWICIQDRMPPATGFLHVLRSGGNRDFALMFENGQWLDRDMDPIDDVTHWGEGGERLNWYDVLDKDFDIPSPEAPGE